MVVFLSPNIHNYVSYKYPSLTTSCRFCTIFQSFFHYWPWIRSFRSEKLTEYIPTNIFIRHIEPEGFEILIIKKKSKSKYTMLWFGCLCSGKIVFIRTFTLQILEDSCGYTSFASTEHFSRVSFKIDHESEVSVKAKLKFIFGINILFSLNIKIRIIASNAVGIRFLT